MSTRTQEEIESVEVYPAKDFFINMLTRDIELSDAVLDLLDNCVDGALRTRNASLANADSLKGFWAKITLNEDLFTIEDNCGGIPWKIAKEYAFKLGKPLTVNKPEGTIGVVGIGMKRAIFKLGRECSVHSNHKADTFLVTVTPNWFKDDSQWKFDATRERPKSKEYGTIIEISELSADAKQAFRKGSNFCQTFPNTVAESYAYLIKKGFSVEINGSPIKGEPVRICFEAPNEPRKYKDKLRPYLYKGTILGVDVFIAIGYRSWLRTEQELDDEKEISFQAKHAGWTVICNDRVVLSNDRSVATGWGVGGVPNFHNQFSCIAGIVEFSAKDTALLPITTTKRGIDTGKEVYALVKQHMQSGLKQFTQNTNRWKGFEKDLRDRFKSARYLDLAELREISSKLRMTSLRRGRDGRQFQPDLPEKKQLKTNTRITFVRPTKEVNKVSHFLFEESRKPNEVGNSCFERVLEEARR